MMELSMKPIGVIFTLFIAYFFIYVITPCDLKWHLETSFDRLLHQIMPALIYSIFYFSGKRIDSIFKKNS